MTTLPTLSRALLPGLAERVLVPSPAMLALPERAVQFGTGALLRGLVEACIDDANRHGAFNGRVVLIGSTGSGRDAQLNAQDGLFTLVAQGLADGAPSREVRVIGAVSRALVAATEWDAVLRCAESEAIDLVFSNTTEVGIALDERDAAEAPAIPRSFPGRLTRFLEHRARHFAFDAARAPVVIPCELIERNGARLREIVATLAERWNCGADFTRWLDAVVFCDTLVDRIVPGAPDAAARGALEQELGYADAMLTMCEPFRLFAIQGDAKLRERIGFADEAGVIVAEDIAPYRERKVRLLNGAHTALVSLALLAGCRTVREAMADPVLGGFVRSALFDEIVPSAEVPGAAAFAQDVIDRFSNPDVEHSLWDITLQGTAKMRVRVIPTIVAYAARTGQAPRALSQAFAGFLAFHRGDLHDARRATGASVPADDLGPAVHAAWRNTGIDHESLIRFVREVAANRPLWDADLTAVPQFVELVAETLGRILHDDVRSALSATTVAA